MAGLNQLQMTTCPKHLPVLSSFMTYYGVVTRVTRRVSLVEQELFSHPEHLSLPPFLHVLVRFVLSMLSITCFNVSSFVLSIST